MIQHFGIEEFRTRRFNYRPGEHVAFFGPTQEAGKTTMAYALLEKTASPELRATTLCMKHRDRVVSAWTLRLEVVGTPSSPPKINVSERQPASHELWPPPLPTGAGAQQEAL